MRYEWTDELTAKTAPKRPRPPRITTAGEYPVISPTATRAVTPARRKASTCAVRPWGARPPVQRRMSVGAIDWMTPYPITQIARNVPTSVKLHPRVADRNTGTPTTNQISLAPKRKKRAAERTLTSRVLERSPSSLLLTFALPSSRGSEIAELARTTTSAAAI